MYQKKRNGLIVHNDAIIRGTIQVNTSNKQLYFSLADMPIGTYLITFSNSYTNHYAVGIVAHRTLSGAGTELYHVINSGFSEFVLSSDYKNVYVRDTDSITGYQGSLFKLN